MDEVLALNGKARTWIEYNGEKSTLHYENQLNGKQWTEEEDLKNYRLRELAISHDGCFVVILTGWGHDENAEDSLDAYNEEGKCVYSILPPIGISLSSGDEPKAQIVADLLSSGDSEGSLLEIKESWAHQGAIYVRGVRFTYCSREVGRLGNIFVSQLEQGTNPNEEEILLECRSESERKTLKRLFPLLRERVSVF